MFNRARQPRSAFTLVELMAVLIIMALLAGGVVYAFGAEMQSARLEDAIGQVRDLDALTRQHARTSGRSTSIVVNVDKGELWRVDEDEEVSHRVRLHPDVRMTRVRVRGEDARGEANVPCVDGRTESYAIRFEAPRQEPRWIVISGLSGAVIETSDDAVVDAIFEPTRSARDDAR